MTRLHLARTLLAALLLCPVIACATDLPGAAGFNQAADALIAALGEPGQTPPVPISDPRVQAVLAQADVQKVFGDATVGEADMQQSMASCQKAVRIGVSYGLAHVGSLKTTPPQSPEVLAPKITALANQNAKTYQDVIIPMTTFASACTARTVPAATAFFQHLPADQRTPIRLGGLQQMRTGFANGLRSVIALLADPNISQRNRHLAIVTTAEAAPALVSAMTLDQRKPIEQLAIQAKATAGADEQEALGAIAKALGDQRCEGLCQFGT